VILPGHHFDMPGEEDQLVAFDLSAADVTVKRGVDPAGRLAPKGSGVEPRFAPQA